MTLLRTCLTLMALAFAALGFAPGLMPARAQIEVRVTEGTFTPKPIAIPDFRAVNPDARDLAKQVSEVIRADLLSSGLFSMVDPSAFTQTDLRISVQPRFADWRVIKAENLVVGEAEMLSDGRVRVAFQLWDNFAETIVTINGQPGQQLAVAPAGWRRVAHKIADQIYAELTGEAPYFDTRILYVAETGPKGAGRIKRLALMDQDGENVKYLTPGLYQVLTPRFSPTEQVITYMSFETGKPRVYLFNIDNGRQETLGNFPGLTFAPRFTPDGRSVLFSQAQGGNTELFIMNTGTRESRQLTDHPAIDTSPSMSPDGRQIVFTSDRGGSAQLYLMNTDGSPLNCPSGGRDTACRLTYDKGGRGTYSTPVWSPRGDWIAFTKQVGGKFHIGVIRTDGSGERLLTPGEAFLDEGPSWAPNGRVLIFFREQRPGSASELWSVDITGLGLRRVKTETAASDPAWSPLL